MSSVYLTEPLDYCGCEAFFFFFIKSSSLFCRLLVCARWPFLFIFEAFCICQMWICEGLDNTTLNLQGWTSTDSHDGSWITCTQSVSAALISASQSLESIYIKKKKPCYYWCLSSASCTVAAMVTVIIAITSAVNIVSDHVRLASV